MNAKIDYKSAGVDIEAGDEAVRRITGHAASTHSKAVLAGLGSFGSSFSLERRDRRTERPRDGAKHRRRSGTKTIVVGLWRSAGKIWGATLSPPLRATSPSWARGR